MHQSNVRYTGWHVYVTQSLIELLNTLQSTFAGDRASLDCETLTSHNSRQFSWLANFDLNLPLSLRSSSVMLTRSFWMLQWLKKDRGTRKTSFSLPYLLTMSSKVETFCKVSSDKPGQSIDAFLGISVILVICTYLISITSTTLSRWRACANSCLSAWKLPFLSQLSLPCIITSQKMAWSPAMIVPCDTNFPILKLKLKQCTVSYTLRPP
jgi:hypothetical protein